MIKPIVGHLILRLTIWLLLTSDLSGINLAMGLAIALLLPRPDGRSIAVGDWLRMLSKILWAIPLAYLEAFEMLLRPHTQEDIVLERVPPQRSSQLIFLDVFVITFTPKTIVLRYRQDCYEIHRLRPRRTGRELEGHESEE